MTDATVSFLLDNVKQLVAQKLDVISNAGWELEQLQKDLESMKSFLEDNANKKSKSKNFKTWENQIREVVYKVEDRIDECVSNAAGKKSLTRTSKKVDLAEAVKKLREQDVKSVFDKARSDFAFLPVPEENDKEAKKAVDRLRRREPLIDKTIVGFEDAIDELINNLKENSTQFEAISIIGMPGLGKTTVASKIYNDPNIDFEFPTRIWINVSEEYNAKDIYLTILKKFTNQDMSSLSESGVALKVREYLNQVKFLLVVDDVWTVEAWKDIKLALPTDKGTGKVLVTSRNELVANAANPERHPHKLRFLRQAESWKLLQFEVYGKEGVWPSDLVDIGQLIAKKCDGLPLALVVIGGILLDKISDSTKSEWTKVSKRVEEYLLEGDKQGNMEKIISLSYDKLPYYLRDCFLFLGTFPEDYQIPAWKLVRLWIAEGFIKQDYGIDLSPEDIAEEYLDELIKRNLVMVDRKNVLGEVKKVRVHDMIRKFCMKEAEDLNLFQEIRVSLNQGTFFPAVSEIGKFRRICLHSSVLDFFKKKPNGFNVRSFLCFSKEAINVPLESLTQVLEPFKLIRVFDGSLIKFPKFNPKLAELIHLRYLTLSAAENFKLLPDSICKLWCLETIVITTSSRTFEVKDISEMKRLRYLKTKAAIVLGMKEKKSSISSLFSSDKKVTETNENLQTLTRLSTQSCKDEVLSRTPNLRLLGIRGDLDSIFDTTCLGGLEHLSKLKLKNDTESKKSLYRVPDSKFFPPKLTSLTLEGTNLEWIRMNTLGNLLKLETLKLKDFAFRGDAWNYNGGGFASLECLHIERADLTLWTVSDHSFGKLRYLVVKNCENLLKIPPDLVRKLKTLEIEHVTRDAVVSVRDIVKEKGTTSGQSRNDFKLIIAPGDMPPASA